MQQYQHETVSRPHHQPSVDLLCHEIHIGHKVPWPRLSFVSHTKSLLSCCLFSLAQLCMLGCMDMTNTGAKVLFTLVVCNSLLQRCLYEPKICHRETSILSLLPLSCLPQMEGKKKKKSLHNLSIYLLIMVSFPVATECELPEVLD